MATSPAGSADLKSAGGCARARSCWCPLGGRPAVEPKLFTEGVPPLRPAFGRVLPKLLSPIDSQIQQPVRRCHQFVAAAGRPVGLVDRVTVAEITDQDAEMPICDQPVDG